MSLNKHLFNKLFQNKRQSKLVRSDKIILELQSTNLYLRKDFSQHKKCIKIEFTHARTDLHTHTHTQRIILTI